MHLAVPLHRAAGLATIAVLLGGCGVLGQVSESRREYEAGWRSGKVLQIGSAGVLLAPKHWTTDCRVSEPAASAQQPYALIEYGKDRWRRRIVPVPEYMSFAAGDLVRVNVKRCDGALKPRGER